MTIKILIVDDDKDLLILMQRFLMKEYPDIEVVSAVSAQDSLRRLEMEQFDAIVCDFYLGPKEMNGLELLEWLRNSDLQIPFIMFTGRSREEVAIRALNLGADFYLKKDVDDFENLFRELIHHIKSTVETRQIEDALAESEERFRSMFESAPIGVARVSPEGRIMEANASLTQMLEYEMGELEGLNVFDLTLPEDEELERQLSQEMLQGLRDSYQMEKRFVRKSGELMWGRLSVSVVLNKRGEPIFTIGMVEDVTELKEEREALRESEARFRALYEEAGIGITLTVGDTIVDVNPAYANLLGYSREELSKMNIRDISNQEDHEIDRQLYVDTIEQGHNTYDMRKRYKHKDGSQIWVDLTVSVVRNEDGEPTFMFGMVQDITEQVKMVDTIKENEQRFREIFEQSPIAIELFDPEGNLLDANSAALATFGLDSVEDFLGFNLFKDPNMPERYTDEMRSGRITRHEVEFDFNWVAKHQMYETSKTGLIHLDILHTPLKSVDGSTITGYLTQIQDISERKEAEKRYQTLFDAAPIALAVTNIDGRIINANQSMVTLTGHTSEELEGKDVGRLYHNPQEREQANKALDDAKSLRDFEAALLRKDGAVFNALLDIDLRGDETLVAIRDITARKHSEEALKESEERFRNVFENMLSGYAYCKIVTDDKGKPIDWIYLEVNDSFEKLTGLKRNDVVGKRVTEAIPGIKEETPELFDIYGKVAQTGEPTEFEIDFTPLDIWLKITVISPERGYFAAIFANITASKNAEHALKESEERFRSVFEEAAIANNLYDSNGILIGANQAGVEMFGVSSVDDLLGFKLFEDPNLPADIRDRLKDGETIRSLMEFDFNRVKENSLYPTSKSGIHYFDTVYAPYGVTDDGSVAGYFVQLLDMTENTEAQKALRESEDLFRSVFENANIGMTIVSIGQKLTKSNPAMMKMLGYNAEEMAQLTVKDFSHPHDMEIDDKLAKESLEAGRDMYHMEKRYLHKDGSIVWGNLRVSLVRGDDDSPIHFIGMVEDINERKQAEAALRDSEQRNRIIVDAMSDLVFVFDSEGKHSEYFSKDESLLIRPWEDLKGKKPEEVVPQDIADQHEAYVKHVRETGESTTYEYELEIGAALRWFQATMTLHEDGESIVVAVKDITGRKEAEESIKQSEKKYRSLWENSATGLAYLELVTDDDGQPIDSVLLDINPSFVNIIGQKKDDVIGKRFNEVKSGFVKTDFDPTPMFWKVALTGEPLGFEFHNPDSERWFNVSVYSPAHGTFVCALQDITSKKLMEQELREKEEFLNASGQIAKVGGWSFDVKTQKLSWTDETYRISEVPLDQEPLLQESITYFHPDEREKLTNAVQRALDHGEPYDLELRYITAKGKELWIHTICNPQVINGKTVKLTGTFQDITERMKAEQALIASEQRFRELIEHSNEVFYSHDLDDNLKYVSPQSVQVFGYTPEEMMVKWTDLITDNPINERGIELTSRARETGEKQEIYELEARNKSGNKIMIEIDESPQKNASGEVIGLVGMVRDITERKLAENELRESELRFRGLFEKSPIGIELYDKDGLLTDANQATLDIFGVSSVDDLKGINLFEDPNLTEEVKDKLRKGAPLAFQAEFDFEVVKKANLYRTSKSGTFPMDVIISPIILGGGDETDAYIVHVRDISDRKIAEDALRDSEKKLRDFFRNAQVPLFRTDLKTGVILDCNNKAATLLGYDSPRDMIRKVKAPDHYIDPDSRRKLTEELSSEGSVQIYETQLKKVSGKELWVEISATNYPSEGYVESVVIDITEGKIAEMALKESEANFKSIFEQAAVGVAKVGVTGSIIEANMKLKQMLGYDEISLEGVNVFEITPDEDSEIEKQLSAELIAGKRDSYNMEKRFYRKDGSIMWGRLTVSVSRTNLGDIDFTIGILEDFTERKQLREILQLSEERFRSIVENAGVGITIVDMEDHILQANQKYQDLVGYSLDELKQMTIAEFSHPEDAEKDGMLFDEVKDGKRNSYEMEKRYIRKDGELIWVHLTTSVVRNSEGEITLIIGIIEDVTDRQEAFTLIEQQRQELSDFAHMISHDLNNNFIKLRLMLNELETEDNRPQTDKIGNLLIDMSDLTKHSVKLADAGLSIGAREVVDLGEIIRESAELHVPSEIEFIGNFSLEAKADETKITQILVNILENAVIHGRPKRIEVSSAVVSGGVNLTIVNDGIQIPQDIRPKIFDYGFSSEEVRRGLGLSYVNKLIEAHGWTIKLRDTRETAFVIFIPNKDLQI